MPHPNSETPAGPEAVKRYLVNVFGIGRSDVVLASDYDSTAAALTEARSRVEQLEKALRGIMGQYKALIRHHHTDSTGGEPEKGFAGWKEAVAALSQPTSPKPE